jgi:hypothetical protein
MLEHDGIYRKVGEALSVHLTINTRIFAMYKKAFLGQTKGDNIGDRKKRYINKFC